MRPLRGQDLRSSAASGHGAALGAQMTGADQELDQAQRHAERREREAQVPVVRLADGADHQRGGEGADVDAM